MTFYFHSKQCRTRFMVSTVAQPEALQHADGVALAGSALILRIGVQTPMRHTHTTCIMYHTAL